MKERTMHDGKRMLCEELDKIVEKGQLSMGDLDILHKLSDTLKNMLKIEMLEDEGGEYSERDDGMMRGYSRGGDWEARGRFERGHSYDGGSSYARRKRDSRGRYSRDDGYSRADGKEDMVADLEEMMHEADGATKMAIKRAIEEIKRA